MNRSSVFKFPHSRYPRRAKEEQFDSTKDLKQSLKEVLAVISSDSQASDRTKLNYLNLFVKIITQAKNNLDGSGYTNEELLLCLRTTLLHMSTEIRAAGFRAIRHILKTEDDVILVNKFRIPYLVARSLDLILKSDTERVEALKVMRRILILTPDNFDPAMVKSLVALANGGFEEKNRMLRSCLGTLCEVGVLNPHLFISCGGVGAITRSLLECQTPKIAECLCGVLLMLMDKPSTRNAAGVNLYCVAAPYCDFHYRHIWKDKNRRDERELRFHSSRRVLLTLLKSWPGILHFCSPKNKIGLKAIIDALYLDQLEVRKGVLDLLYDLFGLPQPEWTDELSVALSAIDPSEPHSSWRLNEGFVVAEGRWVLPHLAKTTPNLIEAHTALLLYCFLENGLLKALTEVIATGDTFISVRATVFLGEILRLMQSLLPSECCNISPPLPSLIEYAATNKPQALGAITALQRLHKMLKKRPASYSLYLDYILRSGCFVTHSSKNVKKKRQYAKKRSKLPQLISKDEDFIKETGVLLNKDAYTWNWNLIKMLLRGEYDFKLDLLDSSHKLFIDHLIEFYMPSNNRYSHMDLGVTKINLAYTAVGIDLIECLVESKESEAVNMLLKLFTDIHGQVLAISSSKSVHDCLFSPQHMINTQCQTYFLFIGQLGTTEIGVNLLTSINVYNELERLAVNTNNDCYVKLIISSLNYSQAGPSRQLLTSVLTSANDSSRLYATEFLLVLLRAGISDFASWAVQLLIKQLSDESSAVQLSAVNILHEACEITDCLESLIRHSPDLSNLGEKGVFLLVRQLALPVGFETINKTTPVIDEIKKWDQHFNYRYVKLVEDDISDALTLHRLSEDGVYEKKSVRTQNYKEVHLPVHLYGQLSHHSAGFDLIMSHGSCIAMIDTVRNGCCESDADILELKAALWALGHLSNSKEGFKYLSFHEVFADIVTLAETCATYSIRAIAYYVLCLIGTTQDGANILINSGWVCARHDRHSLYPVLNEATYDLYSMKEISHMSCCDSSVTGEESFLSTDDEIIESLDSSEHMNDVHSPGSPERKTFALHQRSLLETATFELRKGYDKPPASKSTTNTEQEDSFPQPKSHLTTSRVTKFRDKTSTLNTIPSSPSYDIEHRSSKKIRRHSESCRRISENSATNSESSFTYDGPGFARLRNQDVLGYATLRSLRNFDSRPNDFNLTFTDVTSFSSGSKVRSSKRSKRSCLVAPSLLSFSSIKKYSVKGMLKIKKHGYLGISLPVDILALFPPESHGKEDIKTGREDSNENGMDVTEENTSLQHFTYLNIDSFSLNTDKFLLHQAEYCLKCSPVSELHTNENNPDYRVEMLKHVEQFVNPGWNKLVKQYLLEMKQKQPDVFHDLCLYSEVCKLLAENAYRLFPRRMLHELFIDISYEKKHNTNCMDNFDITDDPPTDAAVVIDKLTNEINTQNAVHPNNEINSKIKTLESLKLTYKENKFPIKGVTK